MDPAGVRATCALERVGTKSVTTTEAVRTRSGEVAAEAKAVLVARGEAGRSRPLTDAEKRSLAA